MEQAYIQFYYLPTPYFLQKKITILSLKYAHLQEQMYKIVKIDIYLHRRPHILNCEKN